MCAVKFMEMENLPGFNKRVDNERNDLNILSGVYRLTFSFGKNSIWVGVSTRKSN